MNRPHLASRSPLRREWFLVFSTLTCAIVLASGEGMWDHLSSWPFLLFVFIWLFAAVLGSALAVVRHAEHLAELLGEPYGTLILTLSVTIIEITSISAVMLHGEANPTLARDTLLAVVMIILNGMVGLSLLIGGLRHREQHHNLQGANIYLSATIPLIVLSLVLPNFTQTTQGPTLSFPQQVFLIFVSIGLYATFLIVQTGRHSSYFSVPSEVQSARRPRPRPEQVVVPSLMLMSHLVPALFLAEQLAHPIDYLVETLHEPAAVGGVILAVLVATPEAIGAVRAAMANQLQRSVNIFLGSILSTIGLTIPAMVIISELTGQSLILGVQHADLIMLVLTLAVSMVTFASGRTNIIQGMVHLVLFAAYFLLIFQG
ncbi:MAG TPA: calcium:proton antiporter [Burkholderiales bacterium]|nr:calcium:proton antiporter [Burkholderiales bacterium]